MKRPLNCSVIVLSLALCCRILLKFQLEIFDNSSYVDSNAVLEEVYEHMMLWLMDEDVNIAVNCQVQMCFLWPLQAAVAPPPLCRSVGRVIFETSPGLLSKGCWCLQAQTGDANLLARAAIIELVLATDMKQHFSILSQFQVPVVSFLVSHACANVLLKQQLGEQQWWCLPCPDAASCQKSWKLFLRQHAHTASCIAHWFISQTILIPAAQHSCSLHSGLCIFDCCQISCAWALSCPGRLC